MPKLFVLDTSVLLHAPTTVLDAFGSHTIIIPVGVLEELDGLKGSQRVGVEAREILRRLDELRETGSLNTGVKTSGGGTLRVYINENGWGRLPNSFEKSFDNSYLIACMELKERIDGDPIVFVSKDRALRIKADSLGIKAEDYKNDKTAPVDQLQTGFAELTISPGALNMIHRAKDKTLSNYPSLCGITSDALNSLAHNTCCVLHEETSDTYALAVYDKSAGLFRLVHKPKSSKDGSVVPKTDEQAFALHLAEDPNITLLTLSGRSGSGKTLMALLAGYKLVNAGKLEKLLVFRPTIEVGEPLGFMPGSLDEKMAPWSWPIINNLAMIAAEGKDMSSGRKIIQGMLEAGKIEIMPINFVRGGTFHRSYVVIDEAQNLTPHAVKTAITRAGEGTLVRVTGDLGQIDGHRLGPESNGLARIIEVFYDRSFYGHLLLKISVRSLLAEIADQSL
jgi:PhoH-like ATPase